jgi:transposase
MRNHSTEFKLEVVQSFLAGDGGAKLLARRWSLPEEKIRTWVSHFRLHGIEELRPKRSAYIVQFKLQVLSHQDREQVSSRQVAAIYDIRNFNQVVVWRRNLLQGGVDSLGNKRGHEYAASMTSTRAGTETDVSPQLCAVQQRKPSTSNSCSG